MVGCAALAELASVFGGNLFGSAVPGCVIPCSIVLEGVVPACVGHAPAAATAAAGGICAGPLIRVVFAFTVAAGRAVSCAVAPVAPSTFPVVLVVPFQTPLFPFSFVHRRD
ncbi:hypothetical protein BC828DRAFT_400904 [Blastocladiella britannica]|nr:hypothetical protein BC828DRAFT_400904 [Blastocladiella britannica]